MAEKGKEEKGHNISARFEPVEEGEGGEERGGEG